MRISLKRKNEHKKQTKKAAEADIMRLMLPSILGMLLCAVCLAGTTWAWFTATSSVDDLSINVAKFEVDVRFDPEADVTRSGDTYNITKDKEYEVTLEATGTASKGYCIVTVDGDSYYTFMKKDDTTSFTVCSNSGKLTITTTWNSNLVDDKQLLSSSKKIGNGTVKSDSQDTNDNNTEEHSNKATSEPKKSDDDKAEQGNDDDINAQPEEPQETTPEEESNSETGE